MMGTRPSPPAAQEGEVITWRINPLLRRPRRTALALVLVAVLLIVIWWLFADTPALGMLLAGAFLLSLWRLFIPARYRVDDSGVGVDYGIYRQHFSWDRFRRLGEDANGLYLSPFGFPNRLDSFRSVFLAVDEPLKSRVADFAGRRLKPGCNGPGGKEPAGTGRK